MRDRLDLVEAQLAEHRQQMERLLDLYLAGAFPKQALTDRKVNLEPIISALEKQRASL